MATARAGPRAASRRLLRCPDRRNDLLDAARNKRMPGSCCEPARSDAGFVPGLVVAAQHQPKALGATLLRAGHLYKRLYSRTAFRLAPCKTTVVFGINLLPGQPARSLAAAGTGKRIDLVRAFLSQPFRGACTDSGDAGTVPTMRQYAAPCDLVARSGWQGFLLRDPERLDCIEAAAAFRVVMDQASDYRIAATLWHPSVGVLWRLAGCKLG